MFPHSWRRFLNSLFPKSSARQRKDRRGTFRRSDRRLRLERLEDRITPSNVVTDTNTGLTYGTIQAAVTAANPGDTLQASAGTYTENVTVNKSLTIEGAQHGVDAQNGRPGAQESILDGSGNGGQTVFNITASNVTIDGFTLEGSTSANTFGPAVLLNSGTSGSHIVNNIIQNNYAGLFLSNNSTTNQTVVQGNLFQDNNGGLNTDIYADQFTAGAGGVNDVLIDNNTFTNSSATENSWALGISNTNPTPFTNITFSNNSVTNHGRGVYFYDTTNITVSNNDFLNLVGQHYAVGLFNGDSTVAISNNRIDGGYDGLQLADDFGTANSSVTVNQNSLTNLSHFGITFIDEGGSAYTGTLDATNNWWGIPPARPLPITPVAWARPFSTRTTRSTSRPT